MGIALHPFSGILDPERLGTPLECWHYDVMERVLAMPSQGFRRAGTIGQMLALWNLCTFSSLCSTAHDFGRKSFPRLTEDQTGCKHTLLLLFALFWFRSIWCIKIAWLYASFNVDLCPHPRAGEVPVSAAVTIRAAIMVVETTTWLSLCYQTWPRESNQMCIVHNFHHGFLSDP